MSGGGKKVCKGRMGSSIATDVDPRQLEKMEKKLECDTREAQTQRENKHRLDEVVHRLEKSLQEMKHATQKFTMEIEVELLTTLGFESQIS